MAEKWEMELLKHESNNKVDFTSAEKEIKSLKHRMDSQEEQTKTIQSLVVTVKELAVNMHNMLEVQTAMNVRVETLEGKPAKRWEMIAGTALSVIVGGIIGYVLIRLGISK